MGTGAEVLLGMGLLLAAGLAAVALYRWKQRRRGRRVEGLVREYLTGRYGRVPHALLIDCSDDERWPVLVAFDDPGTGSRHRLQFACWGPPPGFALLSDKEDPRASHP